MVEYLYKKTFKRFVYLLMINNVKFEKPFIQKLAYLVKNIYNKEVEFNIINLYKMYYYYYYYILRLLTKRYKELLAIRLRKPFIDKNLKHPSFASFLCSSLLIYGS
jgi:hypothetical protein